MKILRTLLIGLFAITSVGMASAQDKTATLKIQFKYKGDVPKLKPVNVTTDKEFCGQKEIPDERLIVDQETKGIKNVVVFVKTGKRGSKLPPQKPPQKPRNLKFAFNDCRISPHILLARVGDTIEVNNNDGVGHSLNYGGLANGFGLAIPPPQQIQKLKLVESEPTLIPVACNIHPWMKAHVLVVEHPFAAVSDEDGMLEIKGLPVGTKLVFQAWHETGTFKEKILIKGQETKWLKNLLELELKSGVHDMGTVEIPADQFDLE